MSKNNIFDLSQIASKSTNVKKDTAKESTPSEQEALESLKDYILVPKEEWGKLPKQTFIKYMRTNGEMKKGGFILDIFKLRDKDNIEYIKIEILPGYYPNARKFIVSSKSIEKLWKKGNSTIVDETEESSSGTTATNVNSDKDIKLIHDKIKYLDEENKRFNEINNVYKEYRKQDEERITQLSKMLEYSIRDITTMKNEVQRISNENARIVRIIRQQQISKK